jgi:hypothetical protein
MDPPLDARWYATNGADVPATILIGHTISFCS